MKDRLRGMVWGAFIGDALSLGAHWVYNTNVIDKKLGTPDRFSDPIASYHSGKRAGDLTHYGDQMLVLLESLSKTKAYDGDHFARHWRTFFGSYEGYFDKATKTTLEQMDNSDDLQNSGSSSDDLAGASRIAPLVYAHHDHPESLDRSVRAQTKMTHDHDLVVETASFFAMLAIGALNGQKPSAGIEAILASGTPSEAFSDLVVQGVDSTHQDTRETIAAFGQMCSVDAALPGTIHLICTYEDTFQEAMVQNVMAGGDSAARGMLVGTVLGAFAGTDAIATAWIDELKSRAPIERLLGALDAG